MQGRVAAAVQGVGVGAVPQQKHQRVQAAARGGLVQRRAAGAVGRRDVHAAHRQQLVAGAQVARKGGLAQQVPQAHVARGVRGQARRLARRQRRGEARGGRHARARGGRARGGSARGAGRHHHPAARPEQRRHARLLLLLGSRQRRAAVAARGIDVCARVEQQLRNALKAAKGGVVQRSVARLGQGGGAGVWGVRGERGRARARGRARGARAQARAAAAQRRRAAPLQRSSC